MTAVTYKQWMDLDRVLVQLWESHSVRVKIAYRSGGKGEKVPKLIEDLLPETTKKGIVGMANLSGMR